MSGHSEVEASPRSCGEPRARVFGVGAAKTGTHSLSGMFEGVLNTAHEADAARLIDLHLARQSSSGGSDGKIQAFLRDRDRRRRLEVDVSQVNLYLLPDLELLFPRSLYILTIRHPIDWLRSIVDDCLRRPEPVESWARFREFRFNSGKTHPAKERLLQRHGLYTIEGYLSYWRDAIDRVLHSVPPERLLIIKTSDLSKSAELISRFCGVKPEALKAEVRLFANPLRSGLLTRLDPEYLITLADSICRRHMAFFPEATIRDRVSGLAAPAPIEA